MSTWGSEQQPTAANPEGATPTPGAPASDPSPTAYPPAPGGYSQPGAGYPQGYPQPPVGYPAQSAPGTIPPYPGQPYPGQQPYPAPYLMAAVPPSAVGGSIPQPAPTKKNPLFGRLCLAVVITALVVATVSIGPVATVMAQLMVSTGSTELDTTAVQQVVMGSAAGPYAAFGLATLVGSLAAVGGLIAGITGHGRASGFVALGVGILAPIVWFAYMMIVMVPIVEVLR